MASVRARWRDQDGVVESTLVIIPLMVLFLITLELIAAVNYRNAEKVLAQSSATKAAISLQTSLEDEVISLGSPTGSEGLRLVISHRSRKLPDLLSHFPFVDDSAKGSIEVDGLAVMESAQ